jgi:hypothetical protein
MRAQSPGSLCGRRSSRERRGCVIGGNQVWVPVLEMKYGSQAKVGGRGKLVISRWLAEQVGLR